MAGAPPGAAGFPCRPIRGAALPFSSPFPPRYTIFWPMAKPTSQERRKQALRQRRAAEQREYDRQDAGYLFNDALRAHHAGDSPAADRFLRKVLILDPNHARAIELLAQIHQAAGHDAEALGYLQRLRKVETNHRAIYNTAVLHHQ